METRIYTIILAIAIGILYVYIKHPIWTNKLQIPATLSTAYISGYFILLAAKVQTWVIPENASPECGMIYMSLSVIFFAITALTLLGIIIKESDNPELKATGMILSDNWLIELITGFAAMLIFGTTEISIGGSIKSVTGVMSYAFILGLIVGLLNPWLKEYHKISIHSHQ